MAQTVRDAAAARDAILMLLTDAENAKVSTAEDGQTLNDGDEFIDLENLDRGVQQAKNFARGTAGHALPRSAVSTETWTRIIKHLGKRPA